MHRDANGRLHLAVAVFGPWSHTLAWDLDWLHDRLAPRYIRRRRIVDFESIWFQQIQILLPAEAGRKELIQLHVSAMTGAICSMDLGKVLVERADGVIFAAPTLCHRLEATLEAHQHLLTWRPPILLYQLDDSDEPSERFTPEELAKQLAIGDHPWFSTAACKGRDVRVVFREIVHRMVGAALIERPLPAPIELLAQP